MRFRPSNIRLINRRSNLPRLLLALSSGKSKNNDNDKNNPSIPQSWHGHSISGQISFPELQHLERALAIVQQSRLPGIPKFSPGYRRLEVLLGEEPEDNCLAMRRFAASLFSKAAARSTPGASDAGPERCRTFLAQCDVAQLNNASVS